MVGSMVVTLSQLTIITIIINFKLAFTKIGIYLEIHCSKRHYYVIKETCYD